MTVTLDVGGENTLVELWFCVGKSTDGKALWGQVQFSRLIEGVR